MTNDPRFMLIGIGAAILAAILAIFMPVSRHRVNQTFIAVIIAILIFVGAFSLFDLQLALPIAVIVTAIVVLGRFVLGGLRSTIYHNFTRYTRRDYWQRKVGQTIMGGSRRRRS